MARSTTQNLHCQCRHGCNTWAEVTRWSCGRVDVVLHEIDKAGPDCTRFSAMRRTCRCGPSAH